MFVYILFVGVLIVFVWVVRWFVCWEGNSITAPPVVVCICSNIHHSLYMYWMARYNPSVVVYI